MQDSDHGQKYICEPVLADNPKIYLFASWIQYLFIFIYSGIKNPQNITIISLGNAFAIVNILE